MHDHHLQRNQASAHAELRLPSIAKVERGLVVCEPWITMLLDGDKTWEIRSTLTTIRGPIGLISKGSGLVSGIISIDDCLGPLSYDEFVSPKARRSHRETDISRLPYQKTYAWVCSGAKRLPEPIRYKHNSGAVIFVRFAPEVSAELGEHLISAK